MSIKISTIIATYNSGKTLKQTLDSIRYQTYRNIEVIIIDGLSTDNTIDIIKEYSDIVTKYISERDKGIYNAFNKGIKMATGDFIHILGSDDCLCDYEVYNEVAIDLKCADTDVISYPVYCVRNKYEQWVYTNRINEKNIFSGCMLPHQGLFVKTKVMKQYMFNENNKIISDYEFLVRYFLDGGKVTYYDRFIAFFSVNGISNSDVDTLNWQQDAIEHLYLCINLNLNKQMIFDYLELKFQYRKSFKNIFGTMIKMILKQINLLNIVKKIMGKTHRHKCNLKYCRWCKRYEE